MKKKVKLVKLYNTKLNKILLCSTSALSCCMVSVVSNASEFGWEG